MNNPHSSARDRLFFLSPNEIEQLLLCDESDDDETVLQLDDEDNAFLENDAPESLVNENVVEVIIESAKRKSVKSPPPKRPRKERELAAPVAEPTPSTSFTASVTEEPPSLKLPTNDPVFRFRRINDYTQPMFTGVQVDCQYEHSKVLQPEVDIDEMPSVYEVFDAVCKFEGKFFIVYSSI